MLIRTVVLFTVTFTTVIKLQCEAKTYYFNINKTNNEYMIYNRGNPTVSYSPGVYLSELRNNVTRKVLVQKPFIPTHPVLDPEWNYNWTNITRSKLPPYIPKYYEAISRDMTGSIQILFNTMPQNSTIIKFNLSEVTINETLLDVDLHFYYSVSEELSQKSLILRLYQIDEDFDETILINPDGQTLLNVIYILQAENGWQIFKLTNAVYNWLKTGDDLLLLITVSKPNEEQFILFEDVNIESLRTFLTLQFRSQKKYERATEMVQDDSCRRTNLYIDFDKLNWMKFIISPSGYNAYQCSGYCARNSHVPNYFKITNSSQIGRKALCCGPTHYNPLPIMYYDRNGNVMIKMYDQMVISGCSCH